MSSMRLHYVFGRKFDFLKKFASQKDFFVTQVEIFQKVFEIDYEILIIFGTKMPVRTLLSHIHIYV
jgi:hypothetical protein